jgi:hypothetical protein
MNKYFVTIKMQNHILLNKVAFFAEESELTKIAKKMRKDKAQEIGHKPSLFSYAIFDGIDFDNPYSNQFLIKHSENWIN